MGKKSRMKKENPLRHKAFLKLRSLPSGGQEFIAMRNGTEQAINPMKHFLLNKPYNNEELHRHVMRKVGQMALGKDKYAELEAQDLQNKRNSTAEVSVETN